MNDKRTKKAHRNDVIIKVITVIIVVIAACVALGVTLLCLAAPELGTFQRLFFVFFLMNAISYVFMRWVLFSIVWLERGGKNTKTQKLYKTVSFRERLSMRFLSPYVVRHAKEFRIWFTAKQLLVAVEVPLMVLYAGIVFLDLLPEDTCAVVCTVLLVQAGIITAIMCCQFDINRNTRYDRMRRRKQK